MFFNNNEGRIAEIESLMDSIMEELDHVRGRLAYLEGRVSAGTSENEDLTEDKFYGVERPADASAIYVEVPEETEA